MKTVTVGRGNYGRIFFVLAALGAFYFYRRQGGSVRGLLDRGVGMIGPVRDFIATKAPSVTQSAAPSATI
ncbi:MAG: hypothetical protein V4760_05325 [Bdellovibrionota bacterium]